MVWRINPGVKLIVDVEVKVALSLPVQVVGKLANEYMLVLIWVAEVPAVLNAEIYCEPPLFNTNPLFHINIPLGK